MATTVSNRLRAGAALALAVLAPLAPLNAGAWVAEVIASGLNNPRGLSFGPDGALYVAEAGFYQPGGPTTVNPRGVTFGYSETGSITRIAGGSQARIVTGLASIAATTGADVAGPSDIAFTPDGQGYVTVGLGHNPAKRTTDLAPVGQALGQLTRFTPGPASAVADVSAYELAFNPAGGPVDSNPYMATVLGSDIYITDAGSNTLLKVTPSTGDVSLVAAFPGRFMGPPVPVSDTVPTGVALGPDGNFYVAELTGFPFVDGAARIYKVTPGGAVSIAWEGFTNIADIGFGADGALYVLELDSNGLATAGGTGQIIRIRPDGTRRTLYTGLTVPTGLQVGADGTLYVSNFGPVAGRGEVLAISFVPEPATWGLMIAGFGAVGITARRRRAARVAA